MERDTGGPAGGLAVGLQWHSRTWCQAPWWLGVALPAAGCHREGALAPAGTDASGWSTQPQLVVVAAGSRLCIQAASLSCGFLSCAACTTWPGGSQEHPCAPGGHTEPGAHGAVFYRPALSLHSDGGQYWLLLLFPLLHPLGVVLGTLRPCQHWAHGSHSCSWGCARWGLCAAGGRLLAKQEIHRAPGISP